MKFQVVPVVLSLGGAFLFAYSSSAQMQFDLDLVFDGTTTPPANPATPWLTATFADQGANQVIFRLAATANLTGAENISQFYFNFDDSLDLGSLGFAYLGATGSFSLPSWTFAENSLKADGDGKYDIRLDFSPGATTGLTFGRNESVSYLLTYAGPEPVTENSFNFFSQPAGGKGPFLVAAHVQNTINGGSAWLASEAATLTSIPEPTSVTLLCLPGLGLVSRWLVSRATKAVQLR